MNTADLKYGTRANLPLTKEQKRLLQRHVAALQGCAVEWKQAEPGRFK
jgi:hypothetical protein